MVPHCYMGADFLYGYTHARCHSLPLCTGMVNSCQTDEEEGGAFGQIYIIRGYSKFRCNGIADNEEIWLFRLGMLI